VHAEACLLSALAFWDLPLLLLLLLLLLHLLLPLLLLPPAPAE
jgi:hypothetical protein